jgi:hypothetical protein
MLSGIMKALYFFYFVAFPDGEPVPTSPGNALTQQHIPLSCSAKAGHPVFAALEFLAPVGRSAQPAITGSSAFADDDSRT